jgi:signal peptidase I
MSVGFRIVLWVGGLLAIVGAVIYAVFVDVWVVPADDPLLTASMAPTLSPGDVLIVSRRSSIDRGYLVRCPDPQAPGRFVVARAIARYGDRLDLSGEIVSIDHHATPNPRACDTAQVTVLNPANDEDEVLACSVEEYGEMTYQTLRARGLPEPFQPVVVDPGRWYLVSDDRHVHLDSRDFGTIEGGSAGGCQHILFRVVGGRGFFDSQSRLSIIW